MKKVIFIIGIVVFSCSHIYADDFTDTMQEALDKYNNQEFNEVREELNLALSILNEKIIEELKKFIPSAAAGWNESEIEGTAAPAAAFGGGIFISKTYYKGDDQYDSPNIKISFTANSPLASSMMSMINSPFMTMGSNNRKIIKIKREKAVQEWNADDKNGKLDIVIEGQMLITIEGNNIDSPDMMVQYAEMLDFKGIEEFIEK